MESGVQAWLKLSRRRTLQSEPAAVNAGPTADDEASPLNKRGGSGSPANALAIR
jgi:hypothetical protein